MINDIINAEKGTYLRAIVLLRYFSKSESQPFITSCLSK